MKTTYGRLKETEVECDNCGITEVIDETYYPAVNEELKDCGWFVRKVYDEWCDFCCYECFREYLKKERK